MKISPRYVIVLIMGLALVSSGCVFEDVEKDSLTGQILSTFGNFSSSNNSTSYEFSLDSLTGSTLMGPLSGVVTDFENNVSEQEGVEMKNMDVNVVNLTEDRAEVRIDYTIEDNETGTIDQNMTLVFVKENGQWTLQDPLKTNLDNGELQAPNPRP